MRLLTTTALALCLPGAALADDILLRADIARALVYASGAEVVRRVEVDLPAGTHRLLIPMRDLGDASLIEVAGPDGVSIGPPLPVPAISIAEGALDTAAEAAARAAVETAEDAVLSAQDALARRDAEIGGLEAQLAVLSLLSNGSAGEGTALPTDPETLTALLGTVGAETARLGLAVQDAREARRSDEETLADRMEDLRTATRALEALEPIGAQAPGILVEVSTDQPVTGAIEIAYPSPDVGWSPQYDLHLDTEAATLRLDRAIRLSEYGAEVWRDVSVRFSAAQPDRRRLPSGIGPDPARISPPIPEAAFRGGLAQADLAAEMAPMAEPVMVMDAAAQMVVSGLSVVYDYGAPVTIGSSGQATLPFDDLSIPVALENRALPRHDSAAFLIAMGENSTGEPILPGEARFFRDGDLVGADLLPLIPAGAEVEMAFGPVDHLRLTWTDLSLDEGDRGFFISENEQRRRIAFTVENTSGEPEDVRVLYAAPFAEQEDLDLTVAFSETPDETDVDDMRGVRAWRLDVAPGETRRIEMTVDLAWPEDMVLEWWP